MTEKTDRAANNALAEKLLGGDGFTALGIGKKSKKGKGKKSKNEAGAKGGEGGTPKKQAPEGYLRAGEFAARLGISNKALQGAINRGLIPPEAFEDLGNGYGRYFHPTDAEAFYYANRNESASLRGRANQKQQTAAPVSHEDILKKKMEEIEHFKDIDFDKVPTKEAERREKVYKAKLAEIKFLEHAGKLVDADKVRVVFSESVRKVRDEILNVPVRVGPELAAQSNARLIELRLNEELRHVLDKLVLDNVRFSDK